MHTSTVNHPRNKLELALIAAATACVLLLDAPTNELHGTAVFYASLIREMVTNGWLSIFEGDRAYFLKPPLVLWLSAGSAEVLGLTNLGVSLVSRLAAVACVLLTYLISKRLFDHRVAALATLVLITNSTFIQFSATLRMDSMLMFGGLLAVYAWLCRERAWASPAIFIGIAIGVLSKGPLGFAPVVLIALHCWWFEIAITEAIRWRWSILLAPIAMWYGYLFHLHGSAPFVQLGADLAKPAAAGPNQAIVDTFNEYVLKPARRYLPWLPFMVVGAYMAARDSITGDVHKRALMRWLIAWFIIVFVAAAAKPDKDIRYLYMGLPVLAIFAGLSLAHLATRFRSSRLTSFIAGLIIFVALLFNYGPFSKPDTRGLINAIRAEVDTANAPLVAIGGYPVPANQPRRQNTHRDWIYFYLGTEPTVLAWSQIKPENMRAGERYFLTNNRSHESRLSEYQLSAKYKTIEMVYAIRK
ncbi:MAG: ArnT family glycosyltransferase [Gammaproteobacteria bacterium]